MNILELAKKQGYKVDSLNDLPAVKLIMEANHMKPNFSLLARELNTDRRTVKKYYHGFSKSKSRTKSSRLDALIPTIRELLSDATLQTFYYKITSVEIFSRHSSIRRYRISV